MASSDQVVACYGEILWDLLPHGRFPGGAPFNVAYHLRQLGLRPHVVSAVGADANGDELLDRLRNWGIGTDGIRRHPHRPTGTVRAHLSPGGDARYDIVTDVAWDEIAPDTGARAAAASAGALVYGSLAQRSAANLAALEELLSALPASALRVFDVNLRPPHDDPALVRRLAAHASVIKLNAEESARLAGEPPAPGREEAHARSLAESSRCSLVCVTAGERGAGLWRNGRWIWEPGRRVAVKDTVGAGDAFLASLVRSLLPGAESDAALLARACRLGEWVATQAGATPAYDATFAP